MASNPPPFTIDHDLTARFSHVTLNGFWTTADLAAFRSAVAASVMQAGASGGGARGKILVIADKFPIQGKVVAGELAQFMTLFGQYTDKLAIVGSDSALQRLQLGRFAAAKGMAFKNEDEARRWLFD